LWKKIPELKAKEKELKDIARQRGDVELATHEGSTTEENGKARLADVDAEDKQA
jgi:hypothetical protein